GSLVEAKIASPRSILALRGSLPFMRLRDLFLKRRRSGREKADARLSPSHICQGITLRGSLLVVSAREGWPRKRYAQHYSQSHDAVIRVYDLEGCLDRTRVRFVNMTELRPWGASFSSGVGDFRRVLDFICSGGADFAPPITGRSHDIGHKRTRERRFHSCNRAPIPCEQQHRRSDQKASVSADKLALLRGHAPSVNIAVVLPTPEEQKELTSISR